MDSNFTHEQSLTLINEMIMRARNNVRIHGHYSLIYWGYLTAAIAITNYVLLHTLNDSEQSFWVWFLMIPAGLVSWLIEHRENRRILIRSHIDRIGAMVWMGFLISFVVFTTVIHTISHNFDIHRIFLINTPALMIMVGMGQFISACIYRQKMWYAIAALTWAGSIACAFLGVDIQFLIFAGCMIAGFAIPGHILNRQSKKSHV